MLMIQSWEEWLTHQKTVLLFSKTWTDRRAGQSPLMKFERSKCRLLGRNNHIHQYMLEADLLESSSAEKDLGYWCVTRWA